jgi:hypothetical protein
MPGLEIGLKQGLVYGLKQGLGSQWQQFPKTQAEALAWSGVTWDYGIGEFKPSGATALWGGVGLPNVIATVTDVATPFAGIRAGRTDDAAGRWNTGSTSALDAGADPIAFMMILAIDNIDNSGDRVLGKFSVAGYQIIPGSTNGFLTVNAIGTVNIQATVSVDHRGIGFFPIVGLIYPGNKVEVRTPLGSASVADTGLTSLANPGVFTVGGWNGLSPLMRVISYFQSVGTNALGIDTAALIARIWRGV